MKRCIFLAASVAAFVALAGGITTNLVVYTDIRKPQGTSFLYADRVTLVISNGLVAACNSEGRYCLNNGLPEREAMARNVAQREAMRTNRLDLIMRMRKK